MSVSFTTKFYQDASWRDISKIVYTSPNIISPAIAGTRSHILPGQGDLGLWYETTSNMYRIESSQEETISSYYNYEIITLSGIDISDPPSYVTVTGTLSNKDVLYEYLKAGLGYTAFGYKKLSLATVLETRVKLQYSSEDTNQDTKAHLPNIFSTELTAPGDVTTMIYGLSANYDLSDTYNYAWVVDRSTVDPVCYLDFDLDKPYKVSRIYMKGHYAYDASAGSYLNRRFFGNYKIYGKLYVGDPWVEIYSGANTNNIETTIFLTSNDNFFKYYRLEILNNTGLDAAFNSAYYALSSLQFSVYDYNSIPTRTKPLYEFDTNGDANIMEINSVYSTGDGRYILGIDNITGSGIISTNTSLYGWGSITGTTDFSTQDSVVFEIISGEAYNCRLTAWDDVTHSTVLNELIQGDHVRASALAFCCNNSKLNPAESFVPSPINFVKGPVYNRILKGNTVDGDTNLFYGDFNMTYKYQTGMFGDYLIFKPMLYGINPAVSYGDHSFVITLHYSYT